MEKTSQESASENKRAEKENPESIQLIYGAGHKKFQYQLDLIGRVDAKSAIIVALDAGILTFMRSWSGNNFSTWFALIGLLLLILGLGASLATVYARLLRISPPMDDFLNKYGTKPVTKTCSQLAKLITRDVEHNERVLMKKRFYTNIATILSICGFILVGIAQIVTIVFPRSR